jgi:hypothetical protein
MEGVIWCRPWRPLGQSASASASASAYGYACVTVALCVCAWLYDGSAMPMSR